MTLATTPLHRDFGIEVQSVDLSVPLAEATSRQLDALLAQHGVLAAHRQRQRAAVEHGADLRKGVFDLTGHDIDVGPVGNLGRVGRRDCTSSHS